MISASPLPLTASLTPEALRSTSSEALAEGAIDAAQIAAATYRRHMRHPPTRSETDFSEPTESELPGWDSDAPPLPAWRRFHPAPGLSAAAFAGNAGY